MRTEDLTGPALDLAVSRASNPEGRDGWGWFERDAEGFLFDPLNECRYSPSTDWSQAGPIIERELIGLEFDGAEHYKWWGYDPKADNYVHGETPLIAAMRCYVTSKLGEFVDIPEELT